MKSQKLDDKRLQISKLDEFIKKKFDLPITIAHPQFITLCFACRGSGKTTLFINLWMNFYRKIFGNLYIISPTMQNDDKMKRIQSDNMNVFSNFDDDIDTVMDMIKEKNERYRKAKGDLMRIIDIIESGETIYDPQGLSQELDLCVHILKDGEPYHLLYIDDSIGSKRLASGRKADEFNNFITTHRWHNTSIFVCSQEYKGVNVALRGNASQILLFKNKDSEIKKVCDEVGRGFDELYYEHISDASKPYEFVAINFDTSTMSYMLDTVVSKQ